MHEEKTIKAALKASISIKLFLSIKLSGLFMLLTEHLIKNIEFYFFLHGVNEG